MDQTVGKVMDFLLIETEKATEDEIRKRKRFLHLIESGLEELMEETAQNLDATGRPGPKQAIGAKPEAASPIAEQVIVPVTNYQVNDFYMGRMRNLRDNLAGIGYRLVLGKDVLAIYFEYDHNDAEKFKSVLKTGLKLSDMMNLEQLYIFASGKDALYINIRNDKGRDKAFQFLASFKEAIDPDSKYRKQG